MSAPTATPDAASRRRCWRRALPCSPRRRWRQTAALAGAADRDRGRLRRRRRHRPRRAQLRPRAGAAARRHRGGHQPRRRRRRAGARPRWRGREPDGHTLGTTNYAGPAHHPDRAAGAVQARRLRAASPTWSPTRPPSRRMPTAPIRSLAERDRGGAGGAGHASPTPRPASAPTTTCNWCCCRQAAGVRLSHVVFQGDPQLRTALLGGRSTDRAQPRRRHARRRTDIRMLSQGGATRSRFRPDVPTLRELGFAVEMASERGLVAPAGTPPAILARLREATADDRARPGIRARAGSPLHRAGLRAGRGLVRPAAAGRRRSTAGCGSARPGLNDSR